MLKYKTRGTSPQGKPRVYLSCHPSDFAHCFEPLAADVLRISDCAIFY